jgi:hypothetical protein
MSRLVLGTAQFGFPYGISNLNGQVRIDKAEAIINLAYSNGIENLDTAIDYGEGEARLGAIGVDKFKVVTKLPVVPESIDDLDDWVQNEVQASLQRLKLSGVYGLLLHHSPDLNGPKGSDLWKSLKQLKSDGIVQKIGVSIYSPTELDVLMNVPDFDLVQAPFNLVDQRLYSSGWLQKLHDHGVEVHSRSTFLQGLLLLPRAEIPEKFETWSQLWNVWQEWLVGNQVSAIQACLEFVQSFRQIDRIIVGVESAEQLAQVIHAASGHAIVSFPDIANVDELLINPFHWSLL